MDTTEKRDVRIKYDPGMAVEARNYCLLGATDKELAMCFEVSESTIVRWRNEYPEFARACKEGKMYADAKVAATLYKQAIGYTRKYEVEGKDGEPVTKEEYHKPNVTAGIFWLKCRRPDLWKDQQEAPPVPPQAITDIEVARRIAFVLAQAVEGELIEGKPEEK